VIFRLLKIGYLHDCCANALSAEIRRNYHSPALYFSPLLNPTNPHTRPRWATQGTRAVGRSVGQSVKSNFPSNSGAQIHSLRRRAFQAVDSANCVICISIPRYVVWAGYWIYVVIFRPHLATCRVWYCL